MHTQTGQREAGDYEDGDIHEDADHTSRSGAEGEEEKVGIELASPPHTRSISRLLFHPHPFMQ